MEIKPIVDRLMKVAEIVITMMLAIMVVLVFANVVMRYGFGTGIAISDEVSRYCFVWLVFLGAVVAMRERAHLGMDSLVRWLPRTGRKLCFVVSHSLMLYGCAVLVQGSWTHTVLGNSNLSAVSGIPLSWVMFAGVVSGVSIAAILIGDLWRLLLGKLSDDELLSITSEEG